VPSRTPFEGTMFSSVVPILSRAVNSEVSYPPRLPVGMSVATATSDELIESPSSLSEIAVAKTVPMVDFLYYPCQTYKGNPWSNWGDGVAMPSYMNITQKPRACDVSSIYEKCSTYQRNIIHPAKYTEDSIWEQMAGYIFQLTADLRR
jgi:hypothetical protein